MINDLDKIIMKLKIKKATPRDIFNLYDASCIVEDINNTIKGDKKTVDIFGLSGFSEKHANYKTFIESCLNISTCKQINQIKFDKCDELDSHNFIKSGYNVDIDNIVLEQRAIKSKIATIVEYLESNFPKKKGVQYIQYHYTANNELCLLLTKKRGASLYQRLSKGGEATLLQSEANGEINTFSFEPSTITLKDFNKQKSYLSSAHLDSMISLLYKNNNNFHELLSNTFQKISNEIYETYFTYLITLIDTVKVIDIINTKCELTKQYNLCKPNISNRENSFVQAKKMRHILIETLDKSETYVPNDICLGIDDSELGILLFGTNAVGKTSLIKSLGVSIIMAQSGFYVPCESFTYCPYKYIFTRIIGNDNIFKGLSTFGVEMSELRVILNNCDKNSLILGDELCSGTETDSALSIFNASLEIMSERKSSFIFATHFHELPHLKTMNKLIGVKCKHLAVKFDHEKQQMYYDRQIQDGQGESIYGLEVFKSLRLPDSFLERCYEIRNTYVENKDNILLLKTSKYNKSKIRNICEFCNKNIGTEIHHLQYQSDSNNNEYIENSFHKDHAGNLSSICKECHINIHRLNLRFEKRKTMNGSYQIVLKKN